MGHFEIFDPSWKSQLIPISLIQIIGFTISLFISAWLLKLSWFATAERSHLFGWAKSFKILSIYLMVCATLNIIYWSFHTLFFTSIIEKHLPFYRSSSASTPFGWHLVAKLDLNTNTSFWYRHEKNSHQTRMIWCT